MSEMLQAFSFPLHGSRLIEASAGTGKTWTIAALYLRLVLGHGGENGFVRPLHPSEILVMTFTRAATRELSDRVRARLVEAAAAFRAGSSKDDFLRQLLESYGDEGARLRAAHVLANAAEAMDEAAVFTIDAWCQRMLREHAFDSASLFDEELVSDESALFEDAVHDYWRQHVYPLNQHAAQVLRCVWGDVGAMKKALQPLLAKRELLTASGGALAACIAKAEREYEAALASLRPAWRINAQLIQEWIEGQRERQPKCLNGNMLRPASVVQWCSILKDWAEDTLPQEPALSETAWHRLQPAGMREAFAAGFSADLPEVFEDFARLRLALDGLAPVAHTIIAHAACAVARRMDELKLKAGQFGFSDMLNRLRLALEGPNKDALRARILDQYPVALIDEFQDTSPAQYCLFDLLYRIESNPEQQGIFLIGDPKQSIYGFRGADIHSYLASRRATRDRHYQLGTNFRSTLGVVESVNQLFLHAEQGRARGAFRFRTGDDDELPFAAVGAQGRDEQIVAAAGALPALDLACVTEDGLRADDERQYFAAHCAEQIVRLLNDPAAGFLGPQGLRPLVPADIAVLVRSRREAEPVRRALIERGVRSVYLSDKDSVFESEEARDVLRWLRAVADPLDAGLARAAFASASCALSLSELARLHDDELLWESRIEQLKALHLVWQRQGVLAMLRRFLHELDLAPRLLALADGERRLTNLLHLAELLQQASVQQDGEQALVRWLAEAIEDDTEGGDDKVLRLESDAALVKVVTVHKSKGLEYPLVFLPFAHSCRAITRQGRSFVEAADGQGVRKLDFSLSDASLMAAEDARLAEDVRLMYVALTRARHYLWLGVGTRDLSKSALGYLLMGEQKKDPSAAALLAAMQDWAANCAHSHVTPLPSSPAHTMLSRVEVLPALAPVLGYSAAFERDWDVGSFTALVRQLAAAPREPMEASLFDDDPAVTAETSGDAPWHRFPRGSRPGNFLHEQLEWMAQEGFAMIDDAHFAERLTRRCERAGYGNRAEDAVAWLRRAASTRLPPLGIALDQISTMLPEMEFWFPSERLQSQALDQICRQNLLDGANRPTLPERQLHGMLKGYADLVFEHAGRYWVLDYKSNALGADDQHYHGAALIGAMAEHRYDVQGAIYLLALHRLLRQRLGDTYDPETQLGGAVFLFLRGIAHPETHGCCTLPATPAMLEALDALMEGGA